MAFKLLEMAPARWSGINAPAKLALLAAGYEFNDGIQPENQEGRAAILRSPIYDF